MMWFSRREFDRNAWFYTDADVRGGLNWKDFCNMELPVPSIAKQREIVKEYDVLVDRINLNNRLVQKLEETAQAIYKQWFVDFEFPDEDGKPYKSNGGEMEFNKELDKQIPKSWQLKTIDNFCTIKGGKRLPKGKQLNDNKEGRPYIKVADLCQHKYIVLNEKFQFVDKAVQKEITRYTVANGDVILSIVGTIGLLNIIHGSLDQANLTENCVKLTDFKKVNPDYLYCFLSSWNGQQIIETKTVGGVQKKLPLYNIQSIRLLEPPENSLLKFEKLITRINSSLKIKTLQIAKLSLVVDLLFVKLSKEII